MFSQNRLWIILSLLKLHRFYFKSKELCQYFVEKLKQDNLQKSFSNKLKTTPTIILNVRII